jgi:hypothetical protein
VAECCCQGKRAAESPSPTRMAGMGLHCQLHSFEIGFWVDDCMAPLTSCAGSCFEASGEPFIYRDA